MVIIGESILLLLNPGDKMAKDATQLSPEWKSMGCTKLVSVHTFDGKPRVDVRIWEGRTVPRKKGVSFSESGWQKLMVCMEKIENMACEVDTESKILLEGNEEKNYSIYASIFVGGEDVYVDLRNYFVSEEDGEMHATKKGICLSESEWSRLKNAIPEISQKLLDLQESKETLRPRGVKAWKK